MSAGVADVDDPQRRFESLCNMAGVDLEPILPSDREAADDPERPRQRAVSVEDSGMGDLLRFDAERLRVLVERHLLYTGQRAGARTAGELGQCAVELREGDAARLPACPG